MTQRSRKGSVLSWIAFSSLVSLTVLVSLLYLYNIFKWKDYPDFGFGFRTATGIKTVGVVTDHGDKAGVRAGDHIVSINNRAYANMGELRDLSRWGLGEDNVYVMERDGHLLHITVTNVPIGLSGSFSASGLSCLVGLCYVLIGVTVFLMKPHHQTSWIFFLFSSVLGIFVMFLYKLGMMTPQKLEAVSTFAFAFAPAVFIHLALSFPEKRKVLQKHPPLQLIPYAVSVLLFLIIQRLTSTMTDVPSTWYAVLILYLSAAICFFLGSCLQLTFRSASQIAKLRSSAILLGTGIASSIPLTETVVSMVFHRYIVPSFNYYLPFLVAFPLSIGYSIVKHDLFDIDAVIKRTYGYILTTGSIAGAYALFVFLTNIGFGQYEITRSPLFPLIFVFMVVFLFNPVRNRIQRFIDRVFYRLEYDYQETVQQIGETMRSLMSLNQVGKAMLATISGTMFIDSGCVMMSNPREKRYACLFSTREDSTMSNEQGVGFPSGSQESRRDGLPKSSDGDVHMEEARDSQMAPLSLSSSDPLIRKIGEQKKEVTLYDIQEAPFFEDCRGACEQSFQKTGATLIVPLIYENSLIGLLALGKKKSGKFYRREDIHLLKTLANQGAVALKNAEMADEMKHQEAVRTNLSRYLSPQIVDNIVKNDVQVNLGGDRKVVTVLFSDIRNFTTITESRRPDELVTILNEYFSEMAEIIFENQGSLDKYIGDAIVAVFGSLIPLENSAEHAVKASVEMMKRIPVLNERWQKEYQFSMQIGIGVNTGEVFLGNVGSPERMEFTVIGDTVNVASRFSGLAKPGQILVTRETKNRLDPGILCTELLPTEVKGKTGKMDVFEISY